MDCHVGRPAGFPLQTISAPHNPKSLCKGFRSDEGATILLRTILSALLVFGPGRILPAAALAPSADYRIETEGKSLPVFQTAALNAPPASFASLEWSKPVNVTITCTLPVKNFKILPASAGIQATSSNHQISFVLPRPGNFTLELNGSTKRALHLFANPPDRNRPDPQNPDVIYFGPGLHNISTLRLRDGQSVYLAAGAIVQAIIPRNEKPLETKNRKGGKELIYAPVIHAHNAKNISIRGPGILDLSALPWHSRKAIWLENCSDLRIEGLTILDAPDWAVTLQNCRSAAIRNIKQISARENGDGINLSNSRNILVEDCFLRSNDDCISVKTLQPPPAQESRDIMVHRCFLWNERARALGITCETRANISHVTFRDCGILHDFSRGGDCAALAILVSDSGIIRNIRFENIRIDDCQSKWLRCWIGEDGWSRDSKRGQIRELTFRNISIKGKTFPVSELFGFGPVHRIDGVSFEDLQFNGRAIPDLSALNLQTNRHVENIRFP